MIDEKELINEIKRLINSDELKGCTPNAVLCEIYDRIMEQSKTGGWIPFTFGEDGELNCRLPDEDEEILTSDGVHVWMDTLLFDSGGYYLDSNGDFTGLAWMPLPKPHKEEG